MADPKQFGALKRDDNMMAVGWTYKNISGAATTSVKASQGFLHSVTINTPIASGTVDVYDNTSGTGNPVAKITLPSTLLSDGPKTAIYDVQCTSGIRVITTGTGIDVTISYI